MLQYAQLVSRVLTEGVLKKNRTGVDTISRFGEAWYIDLRDGFPLLSTRQLSFKTIFHEFLWYMSATDSTDELRKHTKIWDPWTNKDGTVDSAYGKLWRKWEGALKTSAGYRVVIVDQLARIVHLLKTDPESRRMVVTAWEPLNADKSKLPPCHFAFVFNVEHGHLNCHVTQRSGDLALGVPFDMAEYAPLTHVLCKITGLKPGLLFHSIVDCHIYVNHVDKLIEQINRPVRRMPQLELSDLSTLDSLISLDQVHLSGYDPHPPIKYEIAI